MKDGDIRAVLLGSAVLYAVFLPIMLIGTHGYKPAPAPHGQKVEQIFPIPDSGMVLAQVHLFTTADEWSQVVAYEDATPLRSDRYEKMPFGSNGWTKLVLRASDDTNPTKNGRRYYLVLP